MIPGINTILVSVLDGIYDRNKWFLNDNIWINNGKYGSGKSLIINESKILIDSAFYKQIEDVKIND